jgi:hypothetical protein
MSSNKINIEPGVGIFRVIRSLSYKPQYALAEFIDNSISSYENNKKKLQSIEPNYKLKITLHLSAEEIRVTDNAAGISSSDYARAFKPAELPPDTTGLNEFGMGMKTASIWFCKNWKVVTNAINEKSTGIIDFDVEKIIESEVAVLSPIFKEKNKLTDHGTEIILTQIYPGRINGQVIRRIKEHLSDIYRKYLKNSEVEILVLGEDDSVATTMPLFAYVEAKPLVAAAAYKGAPSGDIKWEKEIKIILANGRRITGTAKILEKGDTHKAGLYLFRRNRLILSAAEPFRPEEIFDQSNSYQSQRLFIELEMQGFEVTHTKDDFIWGEGEESKDRVIARIKEELQSGDLKLITQSKEYRARKNERDEDKMQKSFNSKTENTLNELDKNSDKLGDVNETQPQPENTISTKSNVKSVETVSKRISISGEDWIFHVSAVRGERMKSLFVSKYSNLGKEGHRCEIQINVDNAFAANLLNENLNNFEILSRVCIANSYALAQSQKANSKSPGYLVTNFNRMLTEFLSGSN